MSVEQFAVVGFFLTIILLALLPFFRRELVDSSCKKKDSESELEESEVKGLAIPVGLARLRKFIRGIRNEPIFVFVGKGPVEEAEKRIAKASTDLVTDTYRVRELTAYMKTALSKNPDTGEMHRCRTMLSGYLEDMEKKRSIDMLPELSAEQAEVWAEAKKLMLDYLPVTKL